MTSEEKFGYKRDRATKIGNNSELLLSSTHRDDWPRYLEDLGKSGNVRARSVGKRLKRGARPQAVRALERARIHQKAD